MILIEATDHLLDPYPDGLRQAALDQLRSLGVEVILSDPVAEADAGQVVLGSGRVILTHTLLWMAGVQSSPLAALLDVPLVRGGRVPVAPTLEALGLEHVYVVGDMSYLEDAHGRPYPQMIPPAKQQGIQAARNILRRHAGQDQRRSATWTGGSWRPLAAAGRWPTCSTGCRSAATRPGSPGWACTCCG